MAISFTPTKIARFVGALYGVALNNSTYSAALQEIYARGFNAVANEVFVADFGTQTTAAVAATIATNLGLTGAAQTSAAAYLEGQLNAAAAADRGAVVINALNLFAGLSTDATYGAAATTFEGRVANAINYSTARLPTWLLAPSSIWSPASTISSAPLAMTPSPLIPSVVSTPWATATFSMAARARIP